DPLSRPAGRGTIFPKGSKPSYHKCSPAGGYRTRVCPTADPLALISYHKCSPAGGYRTRVCPTADPLALISYYIAAFLV
ncbi:MAG TPA: hypothetical protein VFI65_27005, partial [Streptosporangiaceae bacterium]|nr:hypothetical protein [Streptosporangiaceae bacterium]